MTRTRYRVISWLYCRNRLDQRREFVQQALQESLPFPAAPGSRRESAANQSLGDSDREEPAYPLAAPGRCRPSCPADGRRSHTQDALASMRVARTAKSPGKAVESCISSRFRNALSPFASDREFKRGVGIPKFCWPLCRRNNGAVPRQEIPENRVGSLPAICRASSKYSAESDDVPFNAVAMRLTGFDVAMASTRRATSSPRRSNSR